MKTSCLATHDKPQAGQRGVRRKKFFHPQPGAICDTHPSVRPLPQASHPVQAPNSHFLPKSFVVSFQSEAEVDLMKLFYSPSSLLSRFCTPARSALNITELSRHEKNVGLYHVFSIKLQLIRDLTKCLIYLFQHLIRWGFSFNGNRNPKFKIEFRCDCKQTTDPFSQILNFGFCDDVIQRVTLSTVAALHELGKGRRLADLPK